MNNNEEIKAGFFIQRPIFATVISIIITLVGLIAIQILPIERYPNLTPPQVSVSASYNGADAETIAQNVASILESQIFGVEDMIYMNSVSSSAGYVNVTVTFAIGTDPDLATINVNNKVQTALARLPTEVQQLGITVTKRNPSMLMLVSLVSTDSSYSKAYLANYASLNVVDELKQVSGVGEVSLFGKDDYSIRVWLDPNKTSPYDFYQYWRNVADDDVLKCIRMLTFLPLEEIDKMDSWQGSQLNTAKEILAFELTKMVHGEEEAVKAQTAARALFAGGADNSNMPSTTVEDSDFDENGKISVLDLMIKGEMIKSKGEGRRLVQQGGITVNDEKAVDAYMSVSKDALQEGVIIRKGKKVYRKFTL